MSEILQQQDFKRTKFTPTMPKHFKRDKMTFSIKYTSTVHLFEYKSIQNSYILIFLNMQFTFLLFIDLKKNKDTQNLYQKINV